MHADAVAFLIINASWQMQLSSKPSKTVCSVESQPQNPSKSLNISVVLIRSHSSVSFPDSSQICQWISLDEYSAPMPLERWRVQSLPQRRSVDVYAHRAVVAAAHQMAMTQNGPKQKHKDMKKHGGYQWMMWMCAKVDTRMCHTETQRLHTLQFHS